MRDLKSANFFKIYNAYERYDFYEIPACGDETCELPIIEIGSSELTPEQMSLKPKILITAGLNGTEDVAISTAMNFVEYISTAICRVTFRCELHEGSGGSSNRAQFSDFRGSDGVAPGSLLEGREGAHFRPG